jgi:hypothetical protein
MAACAVAVQPPAASLRQAAARQWRERASRLYRSSLSVPRANATPRRAAALLPTGILAVKLLVGAFAAAAITAGLWPDDWQPGGSRSLQQERPAATAASGEQEQQTQVYRRMPRAARGPERDEQTPATERDLAPNFPLRVKTVHIGRPDVVAALPTPSNPPAGALPTSGNPLAGKRLRYLLGTTGAAAGRDGEVTEVSYDAREPAKRGISIAYCNLFDQKNTGKYGPYLKTSERAKQDHEGQVDPRGPGWEKNLRDQFERRKRQGFSYVELDNADAYSVKDVIGAIELAGSYGLKVIAKNPMRMERAAAAAYVAHPNVYAVIVERGAGTPDDMDALRREAGKPDLPVWFVAFGSGRKWAEKVAGPAKHYRGMGVTYSSDGEYGNAIDILPPA